MHAIRDIDGVTLARGKADAESISLVLAAPSGFSEGKYYPAESLTFTSLEALAALRQICDDLIEEHMELGQRG